RVRPGRLPRGRRRDPRGDAHDVRPPGGLGEEPGPLRAPARRTDPGGARLRGGARTALRRGLRLRAVRRTGGVPHLRRPGEVLRIRGPRQARPAQPRHLCRGPRGASRGGAGHRLLVRGAAGGAGGPAGPARTARTVRPGGAAGAPRPDVAGTGRTGGRAARRTAPLSRLTTRRRGIRAAPPPAPPAASDAAAPSRGWDALPETRAPR